MRVKVEPTDKTLIKISFASKDSDEINEQPLVIIPTDEDWKPLGGNFENHSNIKSWYATLYKDTEVLEDTDENIDRFGEYSFELTQKIYTPLIELTDDFI